MDKEKNKNDRNKMIKYKDQKSKQQLNFGLMGASLDTGNQGVSALAASVVKIILSFKPKARITLFIGNRSSNPQEVTLNKAKIDLPVENYRLSIKTQPQKHLFVILANAIIYAISPSEKLKKKILLSNSYLTKLSECSFVGDIRGGDSFSDIYGLHRLIIGSIPSLVVLLLKKKLILLPQTYGPYTSSVSKIIARFIISNADVVLSRDRGGDKTLKELFKNTNKQITVRYCPDVAFLLDSIKPDKIVIEPEIDRKTINFLIGININGLMYFGGYTRENMFGLKLDYQKFLYEVIKRIIVEADAHILLVPHTFMPIGNVNSDPHASIEILKLFKETKYAKRIHLVKGEYNQSEMKYIINLCDFFIGSRMHACIAALSQSIPTIGVAYSQKFFGVFDSIGANKYIIDARKQNCDSAVDNVIESIENITKIQREISDKITMVQNKIHDTFDDIL